MVATIGELVADGGRFRGRASSRKATVANAGRAALVLAVAYPHVASHSDSVATISAVVDALGDLLEGAHVIEGGGLAFGGADAVASTALAVAGSLRLSTVADLPLRLSSRQLSGFALFFLSHAHDATLKARFYVITALTAVNNVPAGCPLLVRLLTRSLAASEHGRLSVAVTDVFGDVPATASVSATVRSGHNDGEVVTVVDLDNGANGVYTAQLSTLLPPGALTVAVTAVPDDTRFSVAGVVTFPLRVTTPIEFGAAVCTVSTTARAPKRGKAASARSRRSQEQFRAVFPGKLPGDVRASHGQFVHLEFGIHSAASQGPVQPRQVFVTLTQSTTGAVTTFVPKPASSGYRLTLNMADRASLHGAATGGSFQVALIVGDVMVEVCCPGVLFSCSVFITPSVVPRTQLCGTSVL